MVETLVSVVQFRDMNCTMVKCCVLISKWSLQFNSSPDFFFAGWWRVCQKEDQEACWGNSNCDAVVSSVMLPQFFVFFCENIQSLLCHSTWRLRGLPSLIPDPCQKKRKSNGYTFLVWCNWNTWLFINLRLIIGKLVAVSSLPWRSADARNVSFTNSLRRLVYLYRLQVQIAKRFNQVWWRLKTLINHASSKRFSFPSEHEKTQHMSRSQ